MKVLTRRTTDGRIPLFGTTALGRVLFVRE